MSYGEDPKLKNAMAFRDKDKLLDNGRPIDYLPHEVWTSRRGSEQIVDKINEIIRRVNSICGFTEARADIEPVRKSEY